MSFKNDFDIFVGGKSGVFKGIKIGQKECIHKNLKNLTSIEDYDEVTTATWRDDEEKEILIAHGAKETRSVSVYDTEDMSFTNTFVCDIGQGSINGISYYDGAILTAVHSGEIKLWRSNNKEQFVLNAGSNLLKMRHSNINKNIIATGGQENRLKLFDLEKQQQIFNEKNMPHDFLNLRVPIWISDIAYLHDSPKIATVSRYGCVRLYDPDTQRRPVINMEIKDEPLTTLAIPSKGTQVIVGSGKGMMKLIDLRKPGKIVHTYKGLVGSITGLACTQMGPYVVSTSMDRFLRIYNIDTREIVKKVYLTSKLTCLVLRSTFSPEIQDNDAEASTEEYKSNSNNNDNEITCVNNGSEKLNGDSEYDALFAKMEVITSKHKAKLCNRGKKRTKTVLSCDMSELKRSKTQSKWNIESIDVKSK